MKKGFVDVGFWAKNMLQEYDSYLVSEGRTVVKSLRYTSVEEINEEIFLKVLEEVERHNHKGFWKK